MMDSVVRRYDVVMRCPNPLSRLWWKISDGLGMLSPDRGWTGASMARALLPRLSFPDSSRQRARSRLDSHPLSGLRAARSDWTHGPLAMQTGQHSPQNTAILAAELFAACSLGFCDACKTIGYFFQSLLCPCCDPRPDRHLRANPMTTVASSNTTLPSSVKLFACVPSRNCASAFAGIHVLQPSFAGVV